MKSLTRILAVLFGIILFSLLVVSYPTHTLASEPADDPNTISISGDIPKDIFSNGKPASEATLTQAAIFAWKEFIALNWPADPNHRGLLDTNSFFGSDDKPLVWETLRNKVEIYPGDSKKAKNPFDNGSPSENGPHYYYSPEEIDSCNGNTPLKNPYINLDEHDEIGLNVMSAGKAPTDPLLGQQFLYLAKANQQEYDYVKNLRWNIALRGRYFFDSAQIRTQNMLKSHKQYPIPDPINHYFISLPFNTIEIKSAWRQLNKDEDSSKFHVAPVRFYKNRLLPNNPGGYCFVQSENGWGMGALHIIQKTPSAPYFIFATFSQADNIAEEDGFPVEDVDGQVKDSNIFSKNPFDPKIFSNTPKPSNPDPDAIYETAATGIGMNDSQKFDPLIPPDASTTHSPTDLRLYYRNTPGSKALPQVPISINRRVNQIPNEIIEVNKLAHSVISDYIHNHNLSSSPWLNYKLVNVQWVPLTKDADAPGKPYTGPNVASYYLANEVVETDFNLQFFSGQFDPNKKENLITDFASGKQIPGFAFGSKNQYANVVHKGNQFNMGGCMGCHGNATNAGGDFSFILLNGQVKAPEVGGDALSNVQRFIQQFLSKSSQ